MRPFDPRLLHVVPAARRPVAALAAIGIATGVTTIATAFALTGVVVAVVDDRPVAAPATWLGILFAIRAVLAWATEVVAAWAGVSVSTALRSALVRRWGAGPAAAGSAPVDQATALSLATSGASAVEPYAARYLPTLVTAAVVPVVAVLALAVVDWPSALIVVLTVPLLPLFAALIGRATEDSTQRRWAALASLSGHFLDVVRGLPTLVGYGRGRRQVEVVREVSERHRRATMETLRIAFLSSAALELLATISVALVAVTVGLRLSYGSMDLTPALAAILLAPEAYWPIRRVGQEFHAAADGATALDDILGALADPPSPSPTGAPFARVDLRDVSYTYAAGLAPVIRDLDLVVGSGLYAITGPSGVGKTTLLDLIAGLKAASSGSLTAPPSHYVTQRPFLAAGSIRANLTLADDAERNARSDDALWQALRTVGLDGVVAGLPEGLSTRLGDDGFGLSAGQRQRLALARAWLAPEPLLLLDEPTAHLDPEVADTVNALIVELAERRIVVVVTHRPELVAVADEHLHLLPLPEPDGPRDDLAIPGLTPGVRPEVAR
ncbi:thiol reductant ABC exporter subunit CydD [Intrasporangium calvum]|uniref:ABC transporter, CydDC cysteine exporter (CydDC-E) family, permease/ATP-binding protein CydD n=1 Tax=Intrasporangium calvum (strain ATCC 23552 / DSM 43043 / JCM 3097 / NBRC 12989 / NCIMB 10167 / NRRL B-3866 / 7 KIP) TaxID=710696 RepID=E6S636_INTC7|nr:thiol reductant ABC exporter subunit CydD [Intrasporangium calvum]ADU46776.1 ABC transporter, CydDC cysteine exporter (CydDC-E) family, permease/ATP-binding protein CydD [Intrasporangium calvum DSM 43043]